MSQKQELLPDATIARAVHTPAELQGRISTLSLNKASLRIRLEAYYSLIAPQTLENRKEWLSKYDRIYEKVRRDEVACV